MRKFGVAALALLSGAILTILALNFFGGEEHVKERIPHLYSIDEPQFVRAMGELLGPPLLSGNRPRALVNGDEIFPAMLEAIRAARKSICFETYIYWSGEIGKQFADALSERARAGVSVHVLVDWAGSQKMEEAYLNAMREAGVEIRKFRPLHWYTLDRINNRTHRKLLVVDGRTGFTGGVGIADVWTGNAQDPDHWRDTHFAIEGPAVAQMQAAFMENWIETLGAVLHGENYFPAIDARGEARAQVFFSSAREGSSSVRLMYLLAIAAATKSIELSMSYFVPDDLSIETLIEAVRRGVKIRIIVPGSHIDVEIVRRASRARWGKLLEAGVEIHEYQPTMFHCKVMVVDEIFVSVGSTNFDDRSFRLNDEANLNVYDAAFAKKQAALFYQDLKQARQVTYEMWKERPLSEKIIEHAAALFRSQF